MKLTRQVLGAGTVLEEMQLGLMYIAVQRVCRFTVQNIKRLQKKKATTAIVQSRCSLKSGVKI